MKTLVAFKFAFQNIVLPCTVEAEYNTYPLYASLSAGCLPELKLEEKEVYFISVFPVTITYAKIKVNLVFFSF